MWENGEFWIPGLCDLAARVFAEANVGFDPRKAPRSTKATLLYCNFWAGTPGFWDQFMPFVDHIATHAAKVGGMTDKVFYLGRDACYWPFLFECLFTTFLTLNPGIRVHHINYDTSQVAGMNLSPIPKLLLREWAPMVDRWDAVGRHSDDQRAIFRGMQKLCALELLRAHPDLLKIALDL
jgi:hypothetical protein